MKELFETILRRMAALEDTVLVSVIKTDGSTPRKAGAHMLAGPFGRILGTVGGGMGEARALEESLAVLARQESWDCRITLREDNPGGLNAVCGGEMTIRLTYLSPGDRHVRDAAERGRDCLARHRSCRLILEGGTMAVWDGRTLSGGFVPAEAPALRMGMEGNRFFQELLPEGRVFIFGGGHVAQALVPVLAGVGFRCIVLEDRKEFCDKALFPGVEETRLIGLEEWEQALPMTAADYLCVMTRGHEKDISCLCQALHTPARYIGLMGSRRKIAFTNARLKEQGFTDADIARITTPIGLDIAAETPAEIAVSIAAQLIQVRAGK